jgi:DNA-binding NarL/FixJ family response regulator
MRGRQPGLVALVLSRLHDPALLGGDADEATILAGKPPSSAALSAFLVRSLGLKTPMKPISSLPPRRHTPPSHTPIPDNLDPAFVRRMEHVKEEAHRHGLTVQEQQILGLSVEGRSPDDAMRALHIDASAYEAAIRSILMKTGAHNMGQLALRIVRDAMRES